MSLNVRPDGKVECPYCHNVWTPRVESPKFCPYCRRTLVPASSRKTVIVEESIKQAIERLIRCNQCSELAMFISPVPGNPNNSLCLEHHIEWHRTQHQITEQELFNKGA